MIECQISRRSHGGPCRVKGSIVKPPSFDAVMRNLAGFFERVSLEFPTSGEANNRFSKPPANCSDTRDRKSEGQPASEAERGGRPPPTKALAKPGAFSSLPSFILNPKLLKVQPCPTSLYLSSPSYPCITPVKSPSKIVTSTTLDIISLVFPKETGGQVAFPPLQVCRTTVCFEVLLVQH